MAVFDAGENFLKATLGAGSVGDFLGEALIRLDQGGGAAKQEGDLQIVAPTAGEEDDATEGVKIVFDSPQGMIESTGNVLRLMSLEVELDGLDTMGLSWPDVLLLSATGNDETLASHLFNIADDGSFAAVEKAIGEVFVTEQGPLLASLGAESQDARASESFDALMESDLEVVVAGIEGQEDCGLLTLLERFSGGLVGGHGKKLHLPDTQVGMGMMGIDPEDFLHGTEDGAGHKGRTIRAFFNASAKEGIERLGVKSSLTQVLFDDLSPNHCGTSC
jgi:hypothetical protein